MRSILAVAVATLFASGCALNSANSSYASEQARFAPPPLSADVWWEPVTGVTFAVNRPAYVAIFEVSPSDGVGLLYPAYPGQESQQIYGLRRAWPAAMNVARWAYQSSLGASYSGYWQGGPRYLFIIASERPLRISRFIQQPFALRAAMGYQNFLAFRPYDAMDQVLDLALPRPVGGDFTTSTYVVWPQEQTPRSQFRTVRCNGQLAVVPANLIMYALQLCASQSQPLLQRPPRTPATDSTTKLSSPSMPGVIAGNPRSTSAKASSTQALGAPGQGAPTVRPGTLPSRKAIERAYPEAGLRDVLRSSQSELVRGARGGPQAYRPDEGRGRVARQMPTRMGQAAPRAAPHRTSPRVTAPRSAPRATAPRATAPPPRPSAPRSAPRASAPPHRVSAPPPAAPPANPHHTVHHHDGSGGH